MCKSVVLSSKLRAFILKQRKRHQGCRFSKWWRWGESNPRPKRLWPNFYACIPPLVSHPVRRRTGLSGRNRSVVRGRDARAERFKPSPARLCRHGLAGVCRATSGPLVRPRERNRCSQLQFFPFFNEANENPRRAIWSPRIPSKPDHPQVPLRKTARIIFFLSRPVKGDAEISEKTRFCLLRRRPGLKMV